MCGKSQYVKTPDIKREKQKTDQIRVKRIKNYIKKKYQRKNEYKCFSKRVSMLESKNEIRKLLPRFKRESRNEFRILESTLENVNFPIRREKPETSSLLHYLMFLSYFLPILKIKDFSFPFLIKECRKKRHENAHLKKQDLKWYKKRKLLTDETIPDYRKLRICLINLAKHFSLSLVDRYQKC